MSSIQLLRVLVNERLAAAGDEILEAVKKIIAGYEEEILMSKREIRRQRRMLQGQSKPEIHAGKQAGLPLPLHPARSQASVETGLCGAPCVPSHTPFRISANVMFLVNSKTPHLV